MKRLTALFLALAMCLSFCSVTAFATELPTGAVWLVNEGDNHVWYKLEDTNPDKLTIGGTGAMPNFANEGDRPWNANVALIKNVVINSGVTSIGDRAFLGCSSLTAITIPTSMKSIGNYAFNNCTALTSVTIPYGVTSIGSDAFYGCKSLASVDIPTSMKSIGDYAFRETGLTNVTILNGVKYEDWVYFKCASLTDVTISSGVESISNQMFNNCTALKDITIPDGVKSIGDQVFGGCTALKDITIPDSVKSIGAGAFAASGLNSITIPASVTEIKNNTFNSCSSLANVMVGAITPPTLGTNVFNKCDSGLEIHVPAGKANNYKEDDNWKNYNIVDDMFTVTDLYAEHGTVAAKPTSAASGTDVILTVTPDEGYHLKALSYKGESDASPTDITKGETTGKYQFTMPEANVTVTAEFVQHNFTYSATGAVLTATCKATDCDLHDSPLTLTLTTPTSLAYNGSAKEVSFAAGEEEAWKNAGCATHTDIEYYLASSTTMTTTANSGAEGVGKAPVNVGSYVAKVTVDTNKTATLAFTITASTPTPDDDHDVDYEKLAKAGMVAAGVVAGVVVTKIVVDKLHEIKAAKDAAAEATPVIKAEEMPMVSMGSSGDAVTTLQAKLNELGYNCGEVDGVFGNNTYTAVCSFQTAKGLTVDGVVGKLTWGELL